jgi:hypothetical protein
LVALARRRAMMVSGRDAPALAHEVAAMPDMTAYDARMRLRGLRRDAGSDRTGGQYNQ